MPNFKVIVAGGREFMNYEFVREKLQFFLQNKLPNVTIISGGATGADALGEQFAKENNLELVVVPADWEKYGRAAGPRRNAEMAEMADALIAFWDGKSRGTKNMIETAEKKGLLVRVVNY